MRADDPVRPRPLPTVSFALSHEQMQQLRAIAEQRGVSVSQVAREAFEAALAEWESADAAAHPPAPPAENSAPQRLAPVRWPRQLRRRAAHHGPQKRKALRPIP